MRGFIAPCFSSMDEQGNFLQVGVCKYNGPDQHDCDFIADGKGCWSTCPMGRLFEGLADYRKWQTAGSIPMARQEMRYAFERDSDFKRAYIDNIAMLLHDRHGMTDPAMRNQAAEDILKLIFWD